MMRRTCLAVRILVFLYGRPSSSKAATRSGQWAIHIRNDRTASIGVLSGKNILANALRVMRERLKIKDNKYTLKGKTLKSKRQALKT